MLLNLEDNIRESVKERMITHKMVESKSVPSRGYKSFFEEEIWEQPESIKRALNFFTRLILTLGTSKLGGFDSNKERAL